MFAAHGARGEEQIGGRWSGQLRSMYAADRVDVVLKVVGSRLVTFGYASFCCGLALRLYGSRFKLRVQVLLGVDLEFECSCWDLRMKIRQPWFFQGEYAYAPHS